MFQFKYSGEILSFVRCIRFSVAVLQVNISVMQGKEFSMAVGNLYWGQRKFDTEKAKRISSIFALAGNNEDALSNAFGYVLASSQKLMIRFLKEVGILRPIQGKSYNKETANFRIYLQEQSVSPKGGRRDITIEFDDTRIVIEAKIGKGIPSVQQLVKYSLTSDENGEIDCAYIDSVWGTFGKRYLLPLTVREIPELYYQDLQNRIDASISPRIQILPVVWQTVIKVLKYFISEDRNSQELYNFIKKDYYMKYFEYEVICRHVVKDERYEMALNDPIGYYFDGSREDFVNPECLFFCPVYGPGPNKIRTGEYIRKINNYRIMSARDIIAEGGPKAEFYLNVHCSKYPGEEQSERVHVFELGEKISIPNSKQIMDGTAKYYKELIDLLAI